MNIKFKEEALTKARYFGQRQDSVFYNNGETALQVLGR